MASCGCRGSIAISINISLLELVACLFSKSLYALVRMNGTSNSTSYNYESSKIKGLSYMKSYISLLLDSWKTEQQCLHYEADNLVTFLPEKKELKKADAKFNN